MITIANTFDSSPAGIFHLERFWGKVMAKKSGQIPQDSFTDKWITDTAMLDHLDSASNRYLLMSIEAARLLMNLNNGSLNVTAALYRLQTLTVFINHCRAN
ncbi:MAG: hypothetical protein HOP10_04915 [Chitinophagaceae bacterium]|nr:hypothetical protein [Chitinophagaceae bacterium]